MTRLGTVLIEAGVISAEQLADGLRAQVVFGGRLGTNLLELGSIDLDTLSRALGTQHGMPAAHAHHFEEVDVELQERLSPETARRLECIPLRHVFGQRHAVVIASAGPLRPEDLAQIADELMVKPSQLIAAVAAEMRIKFYLERIYRITRAPRFLRVRGSIPPLRSGERTDERRRYLETCAEELVAKQRLARGSREMTSLHLADDAGHATVEAPTAVLEAIARATDRDGVASLLLDAIDRFAPGCDAAAMLLIRGGVAVGWRSFSRSGALQDVVVPLGYPGLVPAAIATATTRRAAFAEVHAVDQILLRMLGKHDGDLAVIPLAVSGHVPALIACAIAPGEPASVIEGCATSAAAAFGRLVLAAAAEPADATARPHR